MKKIIVDEKMIEKNFRIDKLLTFQIDDYTYLINWWGEVILKTKENLIGFFENKYLVFKRDDYFIATNLRGEIIFKKRCLELEFSRDDYFTFNTSSGIGLIDKYGNIVIKPKYKDLKYAYYINTSNGYIDTFTAKNSNNKVGIIDNNGNIIFPFIYDEIDVHHSGKQIIVKQNNNYGVVNEKNEIIIPIKYSEIKTMCSEKYFFVKDSESDEKYIIDYDGNKVQNKWQDKKLNDIIDLGYHSFFSCADYFVQNEMGKWGLIKESGEFIFDCKYLSIDSIYMFNIDEIYYHVQNEKGLWGIVDMNENAVIPFKYDYIAKYQFLNNTLIASYNNKYGVIDTKGNTKIDFKYKKLLDINYYGDEFLAQNDDDTWTIINDKDETINLDFDKIPEIKITGRKPQSKNTPKNLRKSDFVIDKFDSWGYSDNFRKGEYNYHLNSGFKISFKTKYREFEKSDNYIIFKTDDDKKFVTDNNGNILIKPIYQDIEYLYEEDYFKYQKGDKWGIIKADGTILSEAEYDDIDLQAKNYFTVELNDNNIDDNNKRGLIDKFGKMILPFEYDYLSFFENEDKIAACKNGKYGVINSKNEIIIPFIYDDIDTWSNKYNKNLIVASIDEKHGLIDWNNNIILPFEFAKMHIISDVAFFGNKEPMDCIDYLYDFKGNKICNTSFDCFWKMEERWWCDTKGEITTPYYIASHRHENQYGLADKYGNPIIDFKYKEFSAFYSKKRNKFYFIVKNNLGVYGVVDIQDNTIIPFVYDNLDSQDIDCGIIATINDNVGLIDIDNNVLIDFIFPELHSIKDSEYFVAKAWRNKSGIVNKYGESVKINLKNIKELKI